MSTPTRRRVAKRIEEAFQAQHGMAVKVDPERISFPAGFYRTAVHGDFYRWTASCELNGTKVGPSVDCYDTATKCGRHGITLDRLPHNRGWEASCANLSENDHST
jgi:hypothetical protein